MVTFIGIHQDTPQLIKILKLLRRNAYINIFTSLYYESRFNELYISTDGGRCCRPLAVVENNKLLINKKHVRDLKNNMIDFNNLILGFASKKDRQDYYNCDYSCPESREKLIRKLEKTQGVLEYIDVDEMHNCLVGSSIDVVNKASRLVQYTHSELHPSMILGILGFLSALLVIIHNTQEMYMEPVKVNKQLVYMSVTLETEWKVVFMCLIIHKNH